MYKYQGFLVGKQFIFKVFVPSKKGDHEHCNMCGEKFTGTEIPPKLGYGALDGIGWVCKNCFDEYKIEYKYCVMNGVQLQCSVADTGDGTGLPMADICGAEPF